MNPHRYLTDPEMIRTVESIERVDEAGRLYHMTSTWNYYEMPEMFQAILDAGCSTFVTKNLEGDTLFCRNYDYRHWLHGDKDTPLTGINMVCHTQNPAARYRSLGVSDAFWLDWRNSSLGEGCCDDGITDLTAFPMIPYIFMDGMNEKGLAVSILALTVPAEFEEIDYDTWQEKAAPGKENMILDEPGAMPGPKDVKLDIGTIVVNNADKKAYIVHKAQVETKNPGRKTVLHPVLMRLMLDNCANAEEAVALAGLFNIKAPMPGADFHIVVADSLGNCRLLEWIGDEMKVIETNHITNFRVSCEDEQVEPCPRDAILKAGLYRTRKAGMREDFAENLMKLVVQDPTNGTDRGKTQYSCIYNLNKGTLKIFSWGDFSRSWDFVL